MAIPVKCGACAKRFRAKDELAGKRVKCPACGGVLSIPTRQPAEDASSEYQVAGEEAYKLAGDGAAAASAPRSSPPASTPPATPAAAPPQPRCPACSQPLAPHAVLCVACGYDLRTGKRLEVAAPSDGEAEEEEPESQSKLAGAARGARSFLLGCVLSMLGALIGAVVWFVVAWLTGYESGWIAWGLGALTGLGMLLGSQRDNELSGITAAFISIVGILAAKWLIFAQVLLPIIRAAEEMAPGQLPSTTKLFFQTMFDVIDGLFVLFAFFTAYWFGTGRGHGD